MFVLKKGKTKFAYLPVTTSTAISEGTAVTFTSGLLVAATSSTTAANIVGILRRTIASTDLDYATARLVDVEVPVERYTEWDLDFTTTLVATDIGNECDLTDGATGNRGASSIKAVRPVAVYSAVKGRVWVKFQNSY